MKDMYGFSKRVKCKSCGKFMSLQTTQGTEHELQECFCTCGTVKIESYNILTKEKDSYWIEGGVMKKAPLLTEKQIDKLWDKYEMEHPLQETDWDLILIEKQRDADHEYYTPDKEKTIEKIAKYLYENKHNIRNPQFYAKWEDEIEASPYAETSMLELATQLYQELFGGK
jgi:hypothetical protein